MSYSVHLTSKIQVKLSLGNRQKKICLPASSGSIDKDSFLEEEFESNN